MLSFSNELWNGGQYFNSPELKEQQQNPNSPIAGQHAARRNARTVEQILLNSGLGAVYRIRLPRHDVREGIVSDGESRGSA